MGQMVLPESILQNGQSFLIRLPALSDD